MHRQPRSNDPLLGIVHLNIGPEREGGARSLVNNVLPKQDGGYHEVIDNKEVIVTAGDRELVYGARGGRANHDGKHYCLIGTIQDPLGWADSYSGAELVLLSHEVARDAVAYNWQTRRLSPAEVATAGVRGLCGHLDVTLGYHVSGGHTDPGTAFPWPRFEALVNQQINQGTHSGGGEGMIQPSDRVDAYGKGDKPVVLHADGGVFDHTGNEFSGALPGLVTLIMGVNHAISILPYPDFGGYWILGLDGAIYSFPDAGHADWYRGNAIDLPKFGCQAVELQANGNGYDILWECVAPGVINGGAVKHPA